MRLRLNPAERALMIIAECDEEFKLFQAFFACARPSSTETDVTPYAEIVSTWNRAVEGSPLLKVARLTDQRRQHVKARWQEEAFRDNYARLFEKVAKLPLMRGEMPSAKCPNWKADFDWVTKNGSNYIKVLEGKYDAAGSAMLTTDEGAIQAHYNRVTTREGGMLTQGEKGYLRREDEARAAKAGMALVDYLKRETKNAGQGT